MPGTILFVDDEIEMGYMVTQIFESHGYHVLTAENADVAMNHADGIPINVMVLDVDIAGENGLKLMTYLHRNHPAVPIIIYTGMDLGEDIVQQALREGATLHLRKGGPLEDLVNAVAQVSA
jgi:DNA-binding NtrC family response regulator